ncbi:hypothetical protein IAT38_006106 [Cryptococcus sp. DSM 104549]
MDQNHAPEPPLHRRPSSRHAEQASQDTSVDHCSPKYSRPAHPLSSPPTALTSMASEAGPSNYIGRHEVDGKKQGGLQANSQAQKVRRTQRSTWDEASGPGSTAAGAVSMRTPAGSPSGKNGPFRAPGTVPHTAESTSLLTSAPLNRTSSATAFSTTEHPPSSAAASPILGSAPVAPGPSRKRMRAQSLPARAESDEGGAIHFKKAKTRTKGGEQWESWVLNPNSTRLASRSSTPSTHAMRQSHSDAFGIRSKGSKPPHSAALPRLSKPQCVIASKYPAINTHSLRSLDAAEILKNPQLRHDLLFDSLAFRPINAMNEMHDNAASGYAEIFTTGQTPIVDPRTSTAVHDLYWESIQEEIATGCRCVRWWSPKEKGFSLSMHDLANLHRVPNCICGRWRRDLPESEWLKNKPMWPSRLQDLVITLREILVSLMGSTTPCPNHFSHSFSQEALEAHEASCPTVTHALVPELYNALDPEFLHLQARRGVIDLTLFEKLGEAMKVHCAPVRDWMVDDMVQTAMSGDVTKGLRKCFDCAEVMKLDIANHQVHALRPFLWEHASSYEYAAFQRTLASTCKAISLSKTHNWIKSSSRRILMSTPPEERLHLVGGCACGETVDLSIKSLSDGFMELVMQDWVTADRRWPPVVHRKSRSGNSVQVLDNVSLAPVDMPEVFMMDARRIRDFHSHCVDIAMSHMILLAFRQNFLRLHGHLSSDVLSDHLSRARLDIESYIDQLSIHSASVAIDEGERSRVLSELAFCLVCRIVRPNASLDDGSPSSIEVHHIQDLTSVLTSFLLTNVKRDSPLMVLHMKRLRTVLYKVLTDVLLSYRLNPRSAFFDMKALKCQVSQKIMSGVTAGVSNEDEETEEQEIGIDSATLSAVRDAAANLEDGIPIPGSIEESMAASSPSPVSSPDSSPSTIRPALSFHARNLAREIRDRHERCLSKCKDEEVELIRSYGLEGVVDPIKDITERMIRLLAFNLQVFGEVYRGAGMMVGSGSSETKATAAEVAFVRR